MPYTPYLFGVRLVRVLLSVTHDTDFHCEENIGLLGPYPGHLFESQSTQRSQRDGVRLEYMGRLMKGTT